MTRKRNLFFWMLIAAGVPILFLYIAVGTVVFRYGKLSTEPGWKARLHGKSFFVAEVDPRGNAAGKLQKNDLIVAINDAPPERSIGLRDSQKINLPPGSFYTLRVARSGQELEFQLDPGVRNTNRNLFGVITLLFASTISLFVAMLIGLSKPEEKVTQLAAWMGLSVGLIQLIATLEPMQSFFGLRGIQLGFLIWLISFSPISVGLGFDFFHRFPADPEGRSRWRYVKYFLYAWSGTLAIYFTVQRTIFLVSAPMGIPYAVERVEKFTTNLEQFVNALMLVALPLTCAVIASNYKRETDRQNRDRIRWISYGAMVGIAPTILYFALDSLNRTGELSLITETQMSRLFPIATICLTLVPLAMGYSVVKHRVFGINVVIRLGFQYLMARHVLQLLIYLPPVILLGTILTNRDRPVLQILFSNTAYVLLTVAALIGLKFRTSLLELLDRKFFREAYINERILMQLIEEIEHMDSLDEVSRAVSMQIESALHPEKTYVFYRGTETNELVLGHSSGERREDLRITMHAHFLRLAENESDVQPVAFYKRPDVPASEQQWIDSLRVQLIVPVIGSNRRIVGLLLVGEKKSEEAFTPQDKKMLKAVARQIGIVYENLLLKEKVAQGMKVQRDVLAHLQTEHRNLLRECPSCGLCYDSTTETCAEDGTELILTLPVERTIDAKYKLEKLLGRGGMGAVYLGLDLRLHRKVAIKILTGSMFGDRTALSRFEREARASARLNHPNVVAIYDFGGIEGRGAYLVMELLQGFTLRSVLKERGHLDPQVVAAWFDQILRGVRISHQNGIIHRDLKPENVFVTRSEEGSPVLKILDLGLAKITRLDEPSSASLTSPGTIVGTLFYMSPEQVAGSEVDERTDIFSLGVMIVEALTGQQPFTGNTIGDIAVQILQKDYRFPGDDPAVDRLNAALQKCLAKNRNHRYGSIVEMQEEIVSLIARCPPFAGRVRGMSEADTLPN